MVLLDSVEVAVLWRVPEDDDHPVGLDSGRVSHGVDGATQGVAETGPHAAALDGLHPLPQLGVHVQCPQLLGSVA